jgi:hypothetical protein
MHAIVIKQNHRKSFVGMNQREIVFPAQTRTGPDTVGRTFCGGDSLARWFIEAIVVCFDQPNKAIAQMQDYAASMGEAALLAKLATKPSHFGRQARCLVFGKEAIARKREIRQASALLPVLAREAFASTTDVPVIAFVEETKTNPRLSL